MALPGGSTAGVHSLLTLLREFDFSGAAAAAAVAAPAKTVDEEIAEFSIAYKLKQQLLARRAERLARFLRLSAGGAGFASFSPATSQRSTPREYELPPPKSQPAAATPATAHRLSHDDSAEEAEGSMRSTRKLGPHQSPSEWVVGWWLWCEAWPAVEG